MTKLTIQLDGKIYTSAKDENDAKDILKRMIDGGYLLELQPQEEKTEQSKLQKLRAELDRLVELYVLPQSSRAAILGFLNELEKETQPEELLEMTPTERRQYMDEMAGIVPIEKLPEFRMGTGELAGRFDEVVGTQLTAIIKTINTLIERINNK